MDLVENGPCGLIQASDFILLQRNTSLARSAAGESPIYTWSQSMAQDRSKKRIASHSVAGAAMDELAAAVLRLLWDSPERGSSSPDQLPSESTCPDCGTGCSSESSPYCSDRCRERAAFVRQARRLIHSSVELSHEKRLSLGQALWHLLGGGYPARVALVPATSVSRVIERADGKCEVCGGQAITVDHIATGCNRTINLRAVCSGCSRTKPFMDPVLLAMPEVERSLAEIALRTRSSFPLRQCDDPESWDWRAFIRRRKQMLAES